MVRRVQTTADLVDVRRHNLGIVLRELHDSPGISRIDLTRRTGLASAAVTSLVGELIDLGLVTDLGAQTAGTGRPRRRLGLQEQGTCAVGVAFGPEQIQVRACWLTGHKAARLTRRTPAGGSATEVLAALAAAVRSCLDELGGIERAVVSVAVPGWTSHDRFVSPAMGWWQPLPLNLAPASIAPSVRAVRALNDSSLGALAELHARHDDDLHDIVYLACLDGVGGGVIVDGHPLIGVHGGAGELGHLSVDPRGPECGCGQRGCLEQLASMQAIARRLGDEELAGRMPAEIAATLAERAEEDEHVREVLGEAGGWIARVACAASAVVDPSLVLLGGHFQTLAEYLVPAAWIYAGEPRHQLTLDVAVAVGKLGADAPLIGACQNSLYAVLEDPYLVR